MKIAKFTIKARSIHSLNRFSSSSASSALAWISRNVLLMTIRLAAASENSVMIETHLGRTFYYVDEGEESERYTPLRVIKLRT